MKNIHIIGDSQTAKISYLMPDYFRSQNDEHVFRDSDNKMTNNYYRFNQERWMDNGKVIEEEVKIFIRYKEGVYSYSDSQHNLSFSYHPGASAYRFNYEDYEYMNEWNNKSSNIVPFLGYVDIRNYLPRYKNTDDVAKMYVEKTIKKFDKANIVFMEPLPQFITYIINGWVLNSADPDIDFETRYEYHYEFIDSLKKYSRQYGLEDPISSIDIMKTDMIEPHMQPKKMPIIMNDHLKPHLYKPFLDEIFTNNKIKEC